MGRIDLDIATEFLLIAATLVELKTRRLLPGDDDLDLDDELALWEERDLLLARLLECKTFKDAASVHSCAWPTRPAARILAPPGSRSASSSLAPDLLAGVTPADLRGGVPAGGRPKPVPRIDLDHVAPVRASVTDAVAELLDELPRVGRITFRLTQTAGRAARGRRALPRRPRAVQAGPGRPRPAPSVRRHRDPWLGGVSDDDRALADLPAIDVYDG